MTKRYVYTMVGGNSEYTEGVFLPKNTIKEAIEAINDDYEFDDGDYDKFHIYSIELVSVGQRQNTIKFTNVKNESEKPVKKVTKKKT